MNSKKRILILEDFLPDAQIAEREIKKNKFDSIIHIVDNEKDFINALYTFHPDIILSDYSLVRFDGMEALRLAKNYDPIIPFILFTGSLNEDTALECIKEGADDYIIKEHISRLVPAMLAALHKREITHAKKEAEDNLRESESRYRILFNSNPNPMWVYDEHTLKFLIVNDEAVHQYGYSRHEFLSMTIKDIRPKDETDEFVEHLRTVRKTIERAAYTRHKKKDGSIIDVEITSHLFEDIDGTKKRLVMANDVTQKLKIEDAFRNERYLMNSLMDNTPDHIFFKDIHGCYIRINNALAKRFFLENPSDANGKSAFDFFPENYAARIYDEEKRIIKTGIPCIGWEEKDILPDGSVSWYSTSRLPLKDKNGIIIGTFGISRDITKSKEYETELKRLYQAIEQSPASIVTTDLNGNIKYVNKTFEETSGYSLSDVINQNPRILKSGHTTQEEYKILWDTISSGKTWNGEFLNKKKNGDLYWESVIISPVINNTNEIINYLAVKQDITAKKTSAEEIIKAKDKAEKSDKLKSDFLLHISHEIRTQLNTISGINELLKSELNKKTNKEIYENIDHSDVASKKIVRTIELINYMSELFSGNFEYKPFIFDLYEIVKEVFNSYCIDAKIKSIGFHIVNNSNETQVYADENSLLQIVNNIVDNAIKLTLAGSVNIEIKDKDEEDIQLIISDTGMGFDDEYLPDIFQLSSRDEIGYTKPFDCNELGLALVKRYCDINNAVLNIRSIKGEGTTVTVTFKKLSIL